jgi:Uma2 family endonuclease
MSAALSQAGKAPQRVREHRWTRHDIYRLSDEGHFGDLKVNLINGRVNIMPLPGPEHVFALLKIRAFFASILPADHHDRLENALGIARHSDPGPDDAIVAGRPEDYLKDHPSTALIVVEVAITSRKTDLEVKPSLYARAGVPEYWVLDLVNRRLVVNRKPIADADARGGYRYASVDILMKDESAAPLFAPGHSVTISTLLPPQ